MNAPRHHYTFQSIDQAERLVAGANELLVPSDSASVEAHGRICRRVLDYVATTRRKIIEEQIAFSIWSKRNRNKASSQNEKWALRWLRSVRPGSLSLDRMSDSVGAGKSVILRPPVGLGKSGFSERITIEEARKAKRRPFAGARLDELRAPPSLEELVSRGWLDTRVVLEPKGGTTFAVASASEIMLGDLPIYAFDPAISPRASYTPEPVPLLRDAFMRHGAQELRKCIDANLRAAVNMTAPVEAIQHYHTDEEKHVIAHARALALKHRMNSEQTKAVEAFGLAMARGDHK